MTFDETVRSYKKVYQIIESTPMGALLGFTKLLTHLDTTAPPSHPLLYYSEFDVFFFIVPLNFLIRPGHRYVHLNDRESAVLHSVFATEMVLHAFLLILFYLHRAFCGGHLLCWCGATIHFHTERSHRDSSFHSLAEGYPHYFPDANGRQ